MTTPAILALDCATTTGWAIAEPAAVEAWPTIEGIRYGSFTIARQNDRGSLFYNFRRWLNSLLCVYQVGVVAVEEASCIRGRAARMILIPLVGIVEDVCWERSLPAPILVPPRLAKASFTGKGNATKQMMRARAREIGFSNVGEDAADALAVLGVACETLRRSGSSKEIASSDSSPPTGAAPYGREKLIDGAGCDMGPMGHDA